MSKSAKFLAALALFFAGCYYADPPRARETLIARGFTDVSTEETIVNSPYYSLCADQASSCTVFHATAPWGSKVVGLVGCANIGVCSVQIVDWQPKQDKTEK